MGVQSRECLSEPARKAGCKGQSFPFPKSFLPLPKKRKEKRKAQNLLPPSQNGKQMPSLSLTAGMLLTPTDQTHKGHRKQPPSCSQKRTKASNSSSQEVEAISSGVQASLDYRELKASSGYMRPCPKQTTKKGVSI